MKFKIGFELQNGETDEIIIEAETIEEIREQADKELSKRGATNPWSEELGET